MKPIEGNGLDPEMTTLLRADFAPASTAVRDRVSSRLVQSVGLAALSRAPASLRAPSGLRPSAWFVNAVRAHSSGFIVSFALGAALGSAVFRATRRVEPPRVVYVDRPVVQSPLSTEHVTPVPLSANEALPTFPPSRTPPVGALAPSRPTPRGNPAGLAEQQKLLDVARGALARSDYATTLDTLKAHFALYPKSLLAEEREALEIKALAASGRVAEAKVRAARFKTQFPQSLLMPSVNDSVGVIP